MAGLYQKYVGGSTPLDDSPCGYTLYKDAVQLFAHPGRFYDSLAAADPELVEGLVVPIKGAHGFPLGTIWVASHGQGPAFDAEDARILASLADCFGAAFELVRSREDALKRSEQMARAVTDAMTASERKSNSIATVAHELRNPLAPIITSVEALKLTPCDEKQSALIGMIERQASRLKKLLNDMLEIGKIERGEFTLDVKTFDLKAVIDDTIAVVSEQIAGKRQIFRRTMPHERVMVRADPEKFGEVLVNLLQNASKYTPEHGSIELVGTLVGSTLRLVVSDNGMGIPAEEKRKLFYLYSRAENASGHEGLGIGLWLVRRVVELHGGSIHVESEGSGRGSRFTVTLPKIVVETTPR
jgi:signal transduction histidine kinase